ncbi:MAG: hypothetical protein Fur0025_35720 [Oscillatoriaceae cyanobacterium]
MSNQSFLPKLAVTALLGLGAAAAFSPPSQAQSPQYYCGTSDGAPTTMYSDGTGEPIPLIRWIYDGFGNWSPQRRCEEVSRRFQQYENEGTLEFMTTGRMNGYDVVCVARSQEGGCEGRLLFTMPPGRNPKEAVEELLNVAGVHQNNDPRSLVNGRLYIDIDQLIYLRKNSR